MDLRNSDTGIAMIGWSTAPSALTLPGGQKTTLWPMYVSADYFKTLGVRLARGPGFQGPADAVVILGYQFWQNNLSSDPEIIGKTIKLDNVPYVVAGIAPDQFQGHLGLQGRALFVPLERYPILLKDRNARFDRGREWLHIHGRLSQGVSVAQASAAVARITSQLAKQYPSTNELKAGIVEAFDPLGVLDRSRFRVLEAVALTLTGAVLLVVCLKYLRHDAGSQRVARAGTIDTPGYRRKPVTAGQASVSRSRVAGSGRRDHRFRGAFQCSIAALESFRATYTGSGPRDAESRFFHDRDLHRSLPFDKPGIRLLAGASLQSSRDHLCP
jgi:hypothetical protein